jgi:hypothetical protein
VHFTGAAGALRIGAFGSPCHSLLPFSFFYKIAFVKQLVVKHIAAVVFEDGAILCPAFFTIPPLIRCFNRHLFILSVYADLTADIVLALRAFHGGKVVIC